MMYRLRENLFEITLMFVLFAICYLTGTEKYAFVLALTLLLGFLGRKNLWSPELIICVALPSMIYLALGSMSAIVRGNIFTSTVKIVVFCLLPLLFAFALYIFKKEKISYSIDAQFIGSILAYVIINARFLRYYMKVESMFSFSFGAFFLYYAYKKRWGFLVAAAYFLFVTDKRITLLAALGALMIVLILKLFRNDKRLVYMLWGIFAVLVNAYLWLICSGKFKYLSEGIGINTNGRIEMYTRLIEWIDSPILFFGEGLGIVETLLEKWNVRLFANLHNDLLKFYVEIGIVGLFIYLISYVVAFYLAERKFGAEKMSMLFSMTVYSLILFSTDNVSIYILYLIPYYSILFALLSGQREEGIKKKDGKCLVRLFKK